MKLLSLHDLRRSAAAHRRPPAAMPSTPAPEGQWFDPSTSQADAAAERDLLLGRPDPFEME